MILEIRKAIKEIFPLFLLSRVLFFSIVVMVSYVNTEIMPSREGGLYHLYPRFEGLYSRIVQTFLSADSSWYMEIAKYGYPELTNTTEPKHWVFFPLFPLVVAGFSYVFGSYVFSAIFVNSFCFFGGLILLKLFLIKSMSREEVLFIIGCLCFHPMSYFFSTPHTESLFFLLLTLSVYLMSIAGLSLVIAIVMGLLLSTRPTGILLLPGLFFFMREKNFATRNIMYIIGISLFMLSLYFLKLYKLTGDPLMWVSHQKVWGRGDESLFSVVSNFHVFKPWSFEFLHMLTAICCILAILYFFRKKQTAYFLMIGVPLAACFSTGTLWSLSRIMMPLFPLSIFLSVLFKSATSRLCVLLFFAAFYSIMCLLYALHVSIAMT